MEIDMRMEPVKSSASVAFVVPEWRGGARRVGKVALGLIPRLVL